jgi:hypothetical protein
MSQTTTLQRKVCELNKAIVQTTMSNLASVAGLVGRSVGRTLDTSRTAGKTVVGQTRSATERAADTVATGARTVAGQTRAAATQSAKAITSSAKEVAGQATAQGGRVAAVIGREANHVVDETTRKVNEEPSRGTPYEDWTKAQLLDRARELDIDGRATMNKAELVDALRR